MKNLAIPLSGSVASLSRLVALVKSKILNHPVDRLATIRAQISALRLQEKALEQRIENACDGKGVFEGVLFRAAVVCAERDTTAWRKVAEHFNPSHQLIAAHTNHVEYRVVRLGAKLKGS